METQRFTRNPVEVEAVQVTPQNVEEVAAWCKGTLAEADYRLMGGSHKMGAIRLGKQGPRSDKTITVLIGSWITKHKNIFKAWKPDSFEQVYTPLGGGFKAGDLVRSNNKPFDGWEGKVLDPHLIGVDFGSRGKVVFEPQWLAKINEMDSIQLELNAGVEMDPELAGVDPMKSVLDEMRAANRERIERLEKENLAGEADLCVGDLVKVNEDLDSEYHGQAGHVLRIDDNSTYLVEFETDEGVDNVLAWFHKDDVEKVRQDDGETLNLAENNLEGWESSDLDRLNDEKQIESVSLNDLRENLSMERLPELEGVAADPRAVENYKIIKEAHDMLPPQTINDIREDLGLKPLDKNGDEPASQKVLQTLSDMTDEELETFARVQQIGEEVMRSAIEQKPDFTFVAPMDLKDFDENSIVETVAEYERDGVKLPAGTTGKITVVGCDVEGSHLPGVEVLFSDGSYGYFLPIELKKI